MLTFLEASRKNIKMTARDKKEGFKKSGSYSLIHDVRKIYLPFLNQRLSL